MAIPELIAVLDDPKYFPRVAAITALGTAGPRAAKAVPKLIGLLRDQPSIQMHAANALGEIVTGDNPEADAAISALLAVANEASPQTPAYTLVRLHVIQALCRMIGPDDSRVPDLAKVLTRSLADQDGLVRATAALRLIRIGRANDAMPVLKAFRPGEDGYQTAQLGLGLLGSKSADAVAAVRMARRVRNEPWLTKAVAEAIGD
jgi:HEAT repeat protein